MVGTVLSTSGLACSSFYWDPSCRWDRTELSEPTELIIPMPNEKNDLRQSYESSMTRFRQCVSGKPFLRTDPLRTAIAPSSTTIFNHSLESCVVPDDWKKAVIYVLFSKRETGPMLPIIGRDLPAAYCLNGYGESRYKQLSEHLEFYRLLTDCQYGKDRLRMLQLHVLADA